MKTMGLAELVLVNPQAFPDDEATARASGAEDLLERATVTATLAEAIDDCGFVVGASARMRGVHWPVVDPRNCAQEVWAHIPATRVALVMGTEQSGLTNEQLSRCQQLVHIPTQPQFGSLNLAMAVQVLCYELHMAGERLNAGREEIREAPLASAGELEGFHEHLERVLTEVGFLHADHPKQLKLKLRRIFHRAELDRNEINILRGVLAALDPTKPSHKRTAT